MTRIQAAGDTFRSDLPALAQPLPELEHAVSQIIAAGPFSVTTPHAVLSGTAESGLSDVVLSGTTILSGFHIPAVASTVCLESVLGVQRVFRHDDVQVTEKIVAAPSAAAAIVEWCATAAVEFGVSWTHDSDTSAAILLSKHADNSIVERDGLCEAHLHVSLAAGECLRMLITSELDALNEMDPLRWVRLHAAAAARRRQEMARLEIEPAVDAAWELAKHHLAARALYQDDRDAACALVRLGDVTEIRPLLDSSDDLRAGYQAVAGEDANAQEVPLRTAHWSGTEEEALFVRNFMDDVVGYAPDAARGRLILRPNLRAEWRRAAFDNLRVGDALVRLEFERAPGRLRYTITQRAGAYPVRLIFEPVLPRAPRFAFVDGVLASLNTRTRADGVIAPVQIMLDDKRVVEFEMP